jgi:hypothetical protein
MLYAKREGGIEQQLSLDIQASDESHRPAEECIGLSSRWNRT